MSTHENAQKIEHLKLLLSKYSNKRISTHKVKTILIEDEDFFNDYLETCIYQGEQDFWSFMGIIDQFMDLHVKDLILLKLVQTDQISLLSQFLDSNGLESTTLNSVALIEACQKDDFGLVKVLLKNGHRLSPSYDLNQWILYTMKVIRIRLPMRKTFTFSQNVAEEMKDMEILKMMSKKAYILSSYELAFEKLDLDQPCLCKTGTKKLHENCPTNFRFAPKMDCMRHVECCDPINRFFDLTRLANDYASAIPEYRKEYEQIALDCRETVVELLDQCQSLDEVEMILKEESGASKYFKHSSKMSHPRLRLAIEHDQKEFIGHLFCQQALRKVWKGPPKLRFILFTYYHFLFISLILWVLFMEKVKDWPPGNDFGTFIKAILELLDHQRSFATLLASIGWFLLLQDLGLLFELRRTFYNFWRIFDLFMHVCLVLGSTARMIRLLEFEYQNREPSGFEAGAMALVVIMYCNRSFYWLQYFETPGKIVISMSRLWKPIFAITLFYGFLCVSFTTSLVFVLNNGLEKPLNDSNNLEIYERNWKSTGYQLAWSILDPGEKSEVTDFFGERTNFAITLVALYQIATVILLLNLLIAVMNATLHRAHIKKDLHTLEVHRDKYSS